jgi:hypothetical protein
MGETIYSRSTVFNGRIEMGELQQVASSINASSKS